MFKHTMSFIGLLLLSHTVLAETIPALTVSPGGLQDATQIPSACPTFSWGLTTDANRYEVAVFDALGDDSNDYQTHLDAGQAVVQTSIPAPALSWTPATDQCLDDGGSYLWFVRATTVEGESDWSEGRRFEVDFSGSTLADAVAQEVSIQLSQPETWQRVIQAALKAEPLFAQPLSPGREAAFVTDDQTVTSEAPAARHGNKVANAQAATFVSPTAFRISSPNGVVFDDPGGFSGVPAEGPGVRFMWYPRKGALRAGSASGSQWDDANIGVMSIALGEDIIASAEHSTAMGNSTTASGSSSTAMGFFTTASGNFSTAMGIFTTAKSVHETAIGIYNVDYTPLSTTLWKPSDQLFVIGNGKSSLVRSNALVVLKNGNIGIGTSTPDVRLQVDDGGDCEPGFGGHIITGDVTGFNICVDANEIMARDNGATSALHLNNDGGLTLVGGELRVDVLAAGGATSVCRNGSNILSLCSSSARYKEDIAPLSLGLDIVEQLEPVTFKWIEQEGQDLGFVAEEVAEIDPLLATYNEDGEIEGVKYKQLTAVLVNAVKTQQRQIEQLQEELSQLSEQVALEY